MSKADKFAYDLDEDLGKYANDFSRVYIKDSTLKEDFLEQFPVPSNIELVPEVDPFMKRFLSDSKGKIILKNDASMKRIGNKIRDVFSPLAKVWSLVKTLSQREDVQEGSILDTMNVHLQRTVLSLG